MRLNNLTKVLIMVALTLLVAVSIKTEIELKETKQRLNEVNILADSLIFEGLLKDQLINQCKDTTYGEEKTN